MFYNWLATLVITQTWIFFLCLSKKGGIELRCTLTWLQVCMCVHACMYVYMCSLFLYAACKHASKCVCMCVCVHTELCAGTHVVCSHKHTHTHTYIYIYNIKQHLHVCVSWGLGGGGGGGGGRGHRYREPERQTVDRQTDNFIIQRFRFWHEWLEDNLSLEICFKQYCD